MLFVAWMVMLFHSKALLVIICFCLLSWEILGKSTFMLYVD